MFLFVLLLLSPVFAECMAKMLSVPNLMIWSVLPRLPERW